MRKRTHSLNESAFDALSEDAAYWIGFLMADGTITDPPRKVPSVRLSLAIADVDHVEKFRMFLGSTHKVSQSATSKGTPAATLAISSERLVNALARFGVVARKSHTARVVGLENDKHFWRGAVDGDGSIGTSLQGGALLSFNGSHSMVSQFLEFVRVHAPECRASVTRNNTIYRVALAGRHATKIIEVLYGDCRIALSRKLERARQILSTRSADLQPKVKLERVERRRKRKGLCVDCDNPSLPNMVRCEAHQKKMREYALKSYYKKANRDRLEAGGSSLSRI